MMIAFIFFHDSSHPSRALHKEASMEFFPRIYLNTMSSKKQNVKCRMQFLANSYHAVSF